MDLHQARCWLTVVDCGSFTEAAEILHLSQPSVSYAVKQLQSSLGVELFERDGRGVRLTSAGEVFAPAARQLLRAAEVARETVDRFKGVAAGQLTLSVVRSLLPTPLAEWLTRFRERHPEILLRVLPAGGPFQVVEQVASGECEIGLGAGTLGADELVSKTLGSQRYKAIFPPDAELPRGALTHKKLAAYPLAMPSRSRDRDVYEDYFREVGATPRPVVETVERDLILELVVRGTLCAIVPEDAAEEAVARGAQSLDFRPRLQRDFSAIHREAPLSPAAEALLEIVSASCASR